MAREAVSVARRVADAPFQTADTPPDGMITISAHDSPQAPSLGTRAMRRAFEVVLLGILVTRKGVFAVNWIGVIAIAGAVAAVTGSGVWGGVVWTVCVAIAFSSRVSDEGLWVFFGLLPRSTRLPWSTVAGLKPGARPLFRYWTAVAQDRRGYDLVGLSAMTRWQQMLIMVRLVEDDTIPDVEVRVPTRWRGQTADKLRQRLGHRYLEPGGQDR